MSRIRTVWRAFDRGAQVEERATPAFEEAMLELRRHGPAALARQVSDPSGPLTIATLIPSFRRGSGGHATIVRLLDGLQRRGHTVSVWLQDDEGRHARERATVTRRSFGEFFAGQHLRLHTDLDSWTGADVVLATGWQTVARALLLENVGARAYLVQDHEPDFYGASSEALWAASTYRQGLRCIAASAWLAELLRARYDASVSHFDLGVDHATYRPAETLRDTVAKVVFYARAVTPRRAVPLGLLALAELARRRPETEIALFGESAPMQCPFRHTNLGVLPARRLAELYSQATVGMVLSLTNPSLVGLEMMACGLPCVELASESMLASFGSDGPLALAPLDPLAICDALERLLDDRARREAAAAKGLELVATRTWERAAAQVEDGLRTALSSRGVQGSADHAWR